MMAMMKFKKLLVKYTPPPMLIEFGVSVCLFLVVI